MGTLSTIVLLFLLTVFNSISESQVVRFAAIGDYGWDHRLNPQGEPPNDSGNLKVSNMVKSWDPDFIITFGDNNYENGDFDGMDNNIGQYYSDYIYPHVSGIHTYPYNGPNYNRFFPSLGNHDFYNYRFPGWERGTPYYMYFEIESLNNNGTGAERYYDYVQGNIHFFVVNTSLGDQECTDCEPDGTDSNSVQGQWFKARLAASTSRWNIVYMHHPPYCSELNTNVNQRWNYRKWGAHLVMSGHSHMYERLLVDGMNYTINGLGGRSRTEIGEITWLPESQKHFVYEYGAQLVESYNDSLVVKFMSVDNVVQDKIKLVPRRVLKLNSLIQGFYNPVTNLMVPDTVRVYLRNTFLPYAIVDSSKAYMNNQGTGNFTFTRVLNGTSYYVVIKHRNSLETWSKNGIRLLADTTNYNFTTDSAKAYGNNMIKKGTKWCIYGGDVLRDGSIEQSDILMTYNNALNFQQGYTNLDVNGDNYVDISDINIVFNNSEDFVEVIRP